jgi:predicted DNA-binding ArsR family transcriptional regulator
MQCFNSNGKGTRDRVRQWLTDREIEFEISTGKLWRLIYNGENCHKSYETDIEEVTVWTMGMLERLTKSIDPTTRSIASISEVDADRLNRVETTISESY